MLFPVSRDALTQMFGFNVIVYSSSFFFSGTLGGHMGLFLGASILSLSEIIEMLIIVTARMLSKLRHCRPMDSRVTSQ